MKVSLGSRSTSTTTLTSLSSSTRHGVEYELIGDHLFIIRSRKRDLAAGPGDWLVVAPDGEVEVERGDYALRAQRAITRAKNAAASEARSSKPPTDPRPGRRSSFRVWLSRTSRASCGRCSRFLRMTRTTP